MTGYVVTGPGVEKSAPVLGAALAYAQATAARAQEPVTLYVREGDAPRYHVDRDDAGTVTTRKAA